MNGLQGFECSDTFPEIAQALICDFHAAVDKSINSSYKRCLPTKVKIESSQGTECFETFANVIQALICDFVTAVIKSTNYFTKITHL